MDKATLRTTMRARVAALKPLQRAMEEELVNAAIMGNPAWTNAQRVLVYKHKGAEFSVNSLANAAFRDGKTVCFPRVDGDSLTIHSIGSWDELHVGSFGIMEPPASAPTVAPHDIQCAVVPGLAWTKEGARLGQGGGFYDRLLPVGGTSIGVGFDVQMHDELPIEVHDQRVDHVVWAASVLG